MTALKSLEALLRLGTLGVRGDLDAGDGVHAALSMHPILGWPLHPFVCGVFEPEQVFDVPAQFLDREGNRVAGPVDLDLYGTVDVILGEDSGEPWIWVLVLAEGPVVVEALDTVGTGRPFARRSEEPYSFGASAIRRLRLSGRGIVRNIMGFSARHAIRQAERIEWHRPFGLPIGDAPWYAGGAGEGPAFDRVEAGAPRRLGPPDEPLGPGTPAGPGDESDRVRNLHSSIHPWIDAAFFGQEVPDQAILKRANPPGTLVVPEAHRVPRDTTSTTPCVQALTIQAGDPGLARYLGLATVLPVEPPRGDRPFVVVVGAFFGIHRTKRFGPSRLRDVIPVDTSLSQVLANRAAAEFDLAAVQDRYSSPREIRFLPLAAGVGATPDLPDPPSLSAPPGRWHGGDDTWQQQILLHGAPPAGPVALARGALSRHRVNLGRAVALFAGRVPKGAPATTMTGERPSTLSDPAVPPEPATWQVAQADRFGRWSAPASVSASPPVRPAPRPPVPRNHVLVAALDRADTSPRSPGEIRVSVELPVRTEAGALPVASLTLTVAGTSRTVVAQPEMVEFFDVPATTPASSVAVAVDAVFTDTAGVQSTVASSVVTVHDPRPLPVVRTGPALLWSGRRDATGASELALTWPGSARYRVYLSTSDRLAAALGIGLVDGRLPGDPLRASLAGAIWARRAELRDKADFSLITDPPLTAAAGVVSLRHSVPGSLRGVLFVRIVPLSEGNVESDFAQCGLVPVAVPHTGRPAPPTVRVTVADDGSVSVDAEFDGEVRIRRARVMTAEPRYVPVVATVRGPWTDSPLADYQRATYWAEARHDPEPALPPGVLPIPSTVSTPAGVPTGDVESMWSRISLPATAMRVPAAVPDLTGLLTFRPGDVISGALPPGSVQLWAETPAGALVDLATLPTSPSFTHTVPPGAARYHAQLTDPLGRKGNLAAVDPA
jgi:hypothetical protein